MEEAQGDTALLKKSVEATGLQMKLLAEGESLFEAFGDIPDTRLFCPQSREEWEIQTFNVNMEIPNRFGTVDQVGDWIRDCAYLNRETIGRFLSETGHEPVLEYLSQYLGKLNDHRGLVDNLKIFIAVTGALELDGTGAAASGVRVLLEYFANGFCDHNTLEIRDWSLVADIGFTLFQMSKRMRNGQPITSLQNFFVDVRALNASQNVLPSRVISDIYSDFSATGPFKRIAPRKCPDYFLMTPSRCEWMTVFLGFDDSEPKEVWVMVCRSVIYLFVGENKRPLGCIPLQFARVSLGRMMPWSIELQSCQGSAVPVVVFDGESYDEKVSFSNITAVSLVSLRIPDQSTEILHSWLDMIESCIWDCRQA